MKVSELIKSLSEFDPNLPVCIRNSEGDGYYSDWELHYPMEFYPGGKVCISSKQQDIEVAKNE